MSPLAQRIRRRFERFYTAWRRSNFFLPDYAKSPRQITGDLIFTVLRIFSRHGYIATTLCGLLSFGRLGMAVGLFGGGMICLWIRYSLGLRSGDAMRSFRVRTLERAFGSRRRLLEALVEAVRGTELTTAKCAAIAGAYKLADSHLAGADSDAERLRINRQFEQQLFEIVYGPRNNQDATRAEPERLQSGQEYRPADV